MTKLIIDRYIEIIAPVIVVFLGFVLRYQRIVSETFWGEEAIYLTIYRNHSLVDLLLVKHWLIDHPQLYLVFMHYWSLVSTSVFWLRVPSVLAYLISAYFISRISLQLFKNRLIQFIFLALYSVLPYYVGIEWQAVPYSFAFMFFSMTLFFLVKILFGNTAPKYATFLGVSLGLFLYTSFESIYFFASLLTFAIVANLAGNLPRASLKLIYRGLLYSFIAFFSEIVLVLGRVGEFPHLSEGLLGRNNSTLTFFSNFFFIPKSIVFGAGLSLIGVGMLLPGYFVGERRKHVFTFSLSLIGLTTIFMYSISSLFFEVRHPRAYYFFVIVVLILIMMIIDRLYVKGIVLKSALVLLIFLMISRFSIFSTSHSLRGRHLYSRAHENANLLRSKLSEIITSEQVSGQEKVLFLDNSVMLGNWYEGVYLYDYYFKCLDISDKSICLPIQSALISAEMSSQEVGGDSAAIGVFVGSENRKYFLNKICPRYESCEVWNYDQELFEKIKSKH